MLDEAWIAWLDTLADKERDWTQSRRANVPLAFPENKIEKHEVLIWLSRDVFSPYYNDCVLRSCEFGAIAESPSLFGQYRTWNDNKRRAAGREITRFGAQPFRGVTHHFSLRQIFTMHYGTKRALVRHKAHTRGMFQFICSGDIATRWWWKSIFVLYKMKIRLKKLHQYGVRGITIHLTFLLSIHSTMFRFSFGSIHCLIDYWPSDVLDQFTKHYIVTSES